MATKKTVLKVNINCQKCKRDILKTVSNLGGIDQMSVDGQKETLTVIGVVDPVCLVKILRKMKKAASIISVGPPGPPPKQPADPAKLAYPPKPVPKSCSDCNIVIIGQPSTYFDGPPCSIL